MFLENQYMQKQLHFHRLSIFKHALQTRLYFGNPKVEGHMQLPSNLQQTFPYIVEY